MSCEGNTVTSTATAGISFGFALTWIAEMAGMDTEGVGGGGGSLFVVISNDINTSDPGWLSYSPKIGH